MTAATVPADVAGRRSLDPITFEVIRHRMWTINDDQATMAARLSGSPIVYDAYDFNAAILTADGRGLYTGVYIMHHGAAIDELVRRVLDEWSSDDLVEGDMFFTNDPWWGALHANDGILASPIFWEGRLVAWSAIVMHDNDVGSSVPGSWVTGARERFAEAPLFPAVKLAEGFEIRGDIERLYLRNSRTADLNALNMRARVAALKGTHQRIHELIAQYGVDAFLAAQEGILDYVEEVLRRRLREIPDGVWTAQGYLDHDGNTDEVYSIRCQLTKQGDQLVFDMTGTSPQAAGPINCARPALHAAVLGMVLSFLCYDLPWTIGGVRRVTEIVSEEGSLNDAVGAAPTSMASIMATLSTQDVVANTLAQMLLASEKYRHEAQATWSPGICTGSFAGVNGDGEFSVTPIGNSFGGGGGARTFTDGIDTGGVMHSMASRIPNTETLESRSPILQVYRRELRDGGGPGRFRGGVGVEFGCVPHKITGPAVMNTLASGVAMPAGIGLSGGRPGPAVSNVVLRGSDVREQFAKGRIPVSAGDVACREVDVLAAKELTTLAADDMLLGMIPSGAGYGDPVRREPGLVARDVRDGLVSPEMARHTYGVVVVDGMVNDEDTAAARRGILEARLAEGRPVAHEVGGARSEEDAVLLHPVADTVEAARANGGAFLRCTVCGWRLGGYEDDYKDAALVRGLPLVALSPLNERCVPDRFVVREFYCPGCGTALAVDVQERGEPPREGSRLVL